MVSTRPSLRRKKHNLVAVSSQFRCSLVTVSPQLLQGRFSSQSCPNCCSFVAVSFKLLQFCSKLSQSRCSLARTVAVSFQTVASPKHFPKQVWEVWEPPSLDSWGRGLAQASCEVRSAPPPRHASSLHYFREGVWPVASPTSDPKHFPKQVWEVWEVWEPPKNAAGWPCAGVRRGSLGTAAAPRVQP